MIMIGNRDPFISFKLRSVRQTAPSFLPFTTQSRLGPSTLSEEIISESSLSPHPCLSDFSLLTTGSEESTRTVSMATKSRYSTESCKTPVAVTARNEVVIIKDDKGKSISTSGKSQGETLLVVKDAGKLRNNQRRNVDYDVD